MSVTPAAKGFFPRADAKINEIDDVLDAKIDQRLGQAKAYGQKAVSDAGKAADHSGKAVVDAAKSGGNVLTGSAKLVGGTTLALDGVVLIPVATVVAVEELARDAFLDAGVKNAAKAAGFVRNFAAGLLGESKTELVEFAGNPNAKTTSDKIYEVAEYFITEGGNIAGEGVDDYAQAVGYAVSASRNVVTAAGYGAVATGDVVLAAAALGLTGAAKTGELTAEAVESLNNGGAKGAQVLKLVAAAAENKLVKVYNDEGTATHGKLAIKELVELAEADPEVAQLLKAATAQSPKAAQIANSAAVVVPNQTESVGY